MKTVRALTIFAVAALTGFPAVAGNGNACPDSAIDLQDVIVALRVSAGLLASTAPSDSAIGVRADCWPNSGDGAVTLGDVAAILRMATGLDPASPLFPVSTTCPVTVSGNTSVDVPVGAGYSVKGYYSTPVTFPPAEDVALYDAAKSPPTLVDSVGMPLSTSFTLHAPPGRYRAAAVFERTVTAPNGSGVRQREPLYMTEPFDLYHNLDRQQWVRPALPPVPPLSRFSYSLSGSPAGATLGTGLSNVEWPANMGDSMMSTNGSLASQSLYALAARYQFYVVVNISASPGYFYGYAVMWPEVLDLSADATRAYTLPGPLVTVSGTIRDSLKGQFDHMEFRGTNGALVITGDFSTDQYGRYNLKIPPGSYVITVLMNSDGPYIRHFELPIEVGASGLKQDITLPSLPPMRTLSIGVHPPLGAPSTSYQAYVYPATSTAAPAGGRYTFIATAAYNADGRYALTVGDGTYDLTVRPM